MITSAAQLKLAKAFPFDIEKRELFDANGNPASAFALYRDDTNEPVGTPKADMYQPHQRRHISAILDAAEALFDCPVDITTHFHNGHFVSIRPTDGHRRAVYGTDYVNPRFNLRAGYDGTAVNVDVASMRDACLNLDMARDIDQAHVRIVHNAYMEANIEKLIGMMKPLKLGWNNMFERMRALDQQMIDFEEFYNTVYEDPATRKDLDGKPIAYSPQSRKTFLNRLRAMKARISAERLKTRREATAQVSVFEAYQAVQGHVQRKPTFADALRASRSPYVVKANDVCDMILAS